MKILTQNLFFKLKKLINNVFFKEISFGGVKLHQNAVKEIIIQKENMKT